MSIQYNLPMLDTKNKKEARVRPILKWAGGKSQLLDQLKPLFPAQLGHGETDRYFEPFVGGGAVFLDIISRWPSLACVLSDANPELVLLYRTVQQTPDSVAARLREMAEFYLSKSESNRAALYGEVRAAFNASRPDWGSPSASDVPINTDAVSRSAQILFLNRTCFNGLFRVNRKGEFNVPHGRYRNPKILDEPNLMAFSRALQTAVIRLQDFGFVAKEAGRGSFIYYDPPYRPLSATSSFTSYSKDEFGDQEQNRLADTFAACHEHGALQMLSNSDPFLFNGDRFFEDLYGSKGFYIHRVYARRAINSVGSGRGAIGEIVVTNYPTA